MLEVQSTQELEAEFMRLSPAETLISEDCQLTDLITQKTSIQRVPIWYFDYQNSLEQLTLQFNTTSLECFGCSQYVLGITAGCLLKYARDTQKTSLPHITKLRYEDRSETVLIDVATRRTRLLILYENIFFSWYIKPCVVNFGCNKYLKTNFYLL